ncbi:MAG: Dam family site-specific DNA-(adenine-N6)-methyltransferase, partial [Candidatus Bathyarchaeota archaeon]|nr:Dam family site-specific DNA-(adenine-N6)-methyltransferase [Candidatus Bathyarchaeota archaeon]
MVRPVLKWVGGKRRLIEQIKGLFPEDYANRAYHEPFFGGGALFFHLEPSRGSINDVNTRLINFYRVLKEKPRELIEEASPYVYEKSEYYRLRTRFNEDQLSDVEDAAILLYLNKTGYNGLYRVNSKGKYNVPFGRYKDPRIVDEERIMEASRLLENINISSERFFSVEEYANEGDIVYFDPPYLPVSETSDFTAYSQKGFGYEDHKRLKETCVNLHNNGVLFVQSNSFVDPILELYKDTGFRIEIVQM